MAQRHRVLAAAALFALGASAASAQQTELNTPPPPAPEAVAPGPPQRETLDPVAARVRYLHDRLHITPAQEDQWKTVAEVMRGNASTMLTLISQRSDNVKMSAVDDLKSYEHISEAHVDGMKKFISAFETLYAGMSDDQKKNADMVFSHTQRHAAKRSKG